VSDTGYRWPDSNSTSNLRANPAQGLQEWAIRMTLEGRDRPPGPRGDSRISDELQGMREKGEECDVHCPRLLGGTLLFEIRLGLLELVVVLVDGTLEYPQVGFARLPR
jgi:hypothetical protein